MVMFLGLSWWVYALVGQVLLQGAAAGPIEDSSLIYTTEPEPPEGIQSTIIPNQFIVSFSTYLEASQIESILEDALQTPPSPLASNGASFSGSQAHSESARENSALYNWEIKERMNPGYYLPSDFSVIRFSGSIDTLRRKLATCPLIKRVSEEREYFGLFFVRNDKDDNLYENNHNNDEKQNNSRNEQKLKQKELPHKRKPINSDEAFVNSEEELDTQNLKSLNQDEDREANNVDHDYEARKKDTQEELMEREWDPSSSFSGRPHSPILESDPSGSLFNQGFSRQLHLNQDISSLLHLDVFWEHGITGRGVKVGIFDTGLNPNHPHFPQVIKISDWTNQDKTEDPLGHGTFVAGVVGSISGKCPGVAPGSDLYVFRVFTENQTTYTSWFLDAFNYAIHLGIDILNLSLGSPDFQDLPFVEKVLELSANNIVVVSAIGNDGPLYGTLNNPADQLDVIGVSSINFDNKLSPFSSRGMTTWELPRGYGRAKPDILSFGKRVTSSDRKGGCTQLSGTSVASPVVAGSLALLLSMVEPSERYAKANVAALKQVLLAGATRLEGLNVFEQGAGKMDLVKSARLLNKYEPHASCFPSVLDLTSPYFWPYSEQPIFYGSLPAVVNVTILNGMGVSGQIFSEPVWKPGNFGSLLELSFDYPEMLWPWTGYLGIKVRAHSNVAEPTTAEGIVSFSVISPPGIGESDFRISHQDLPLKVQIVPAPPRERRLLWDQFHNLRYPPGYFPRDHLELTEQPFDWNGDHPHTNFKTLFEYLRKAGYFLDVLGEDFSCFNASDYGALLIVDEEDEFHPQEIAKLYDDVVDRGLSVIVIGDWFNLELAKKVQFHDEVTQRLWVPATCGSNLPATNQLLAPFNISFSDQVYSGQLASGKVRARAAYASGTSIARFPSDGRLFFADLENHLAKDKKLRPVPVLGMLQVAPRGSGFLNQSASPRNNQGTPVNNQGSSNNQESPVNNQGTPVNNQGSSINNQGSPINNQGSPINNQGSPGNNQGSSHNMTSQSHHPKSSSSLGAPEKHRVATSGSHAGGPGRIVVFGDSSCLDDSFLISKADDCFWLLGDMLEFALYGKLSDTALKPVSGRPSMPVSGSLPKTHDNAILRYSKTMSTEPLVCRIDSYVHSNSTTPLEIIWNPSEEQMSTVFAFPSSTYASETWDTTQTGFFGLSHEQIVYYAPYVIGILCILGIVTLLYLRDPAQSGGLGRRPHLV